MMDKRKRMLLFGPGHGHNVEAKLRSLEDTSLFEVDFVVTKFDENFKTKFPYINFIPSHFEIKKKHPLRTLKSLWWLFKRVRCSGHYDVVYSLGMRDVLGALFFLLAKRDTKKALEIWSVSILDTAERNKTLFDKIDRYMIKRADFICQYWWGIRERFVELFPEYENKFLMYNLSYPDIYFSGEHHEPQSDFVKAFLARIPNDQIVCFWPRSFITSNNHPLFIESLGIIKRRNLGLLNNFKLYLWGGNVAYESRMALIIKAIAENGLESNIEIVDHPFVPQNDIFAIEERSDLFVQIANDDILSTFIMEILCSGKPFILSNLRTFQFLNEKYDLNIELTDNNADLIADRIEKILFDIQQSRITPDYSRREKCKMFFSSSNTKTSTQILYESL